MPQTDAGDARRHAVGMPAPELYRDRWISCTDDGLVIRGYYFPLGNRKHVPYAAIRTVRTQELTPLTGSWRIWGSSWPSYWAHLDPRRPWKKTALVLDLGRRVKPVITPDDPRAVKAILDRHR